MDDGYKAINGFYLCTESYSSPPLRWPTAWTHCVDPLRWQRGEDHQILISILKNKFNLECSIHKISNGNRIYILSSSKDRLLELIKPYLLEHFYYKFNI